VTDYRARVAELLQSIDLTIPPEAEREAEVETLARERARTGEPEGLKRKFIEQSAPTDAALSGEFEARVSDTLRDHTNERFTRQGFDRAVRRLRESGRALPVLFGHNDRDIHSVVGMVPSDGLRVNDQDQLIARGWIDVMDNLGQKIHKMLRAGALRWSIGGFWKSSRQEGDTRVLELSQLAELSIVPVPANPRVATTSIKNLSPNDLTDEEFRQWAQVAQLIPGDKPMSAAALKIETDRILREMGLDPETKRRDAELRKQVDLARVEALIGEPLDAAKEREQESRELRRKVDELRLEAAADFDSSLVETTKRSTERSVEDLMIELLTGEVESDDRR
jgi:HK97 family phage prohead protease